MNEIKARRTLMQELKNEVQDISCFYETYENIIDRLEEFDETFGSNYKNDFRMISGFLDEDDLDFYLHKAVEDGLDSVRNFINDTESEMIYKLDGYDNLQNITESDFKDAIYDLSNNIESDIEELKQLEM